MDLQELLQQTIFEVGKYSVTVLQVVSAIGLFIAAKVVIFLVRNLIVRKLQEKVSDKGKAYALFQLFRYFLWTIVALLILDTLGITLTYLLAGSAALFVGLGLGLQDVVKDIASGVFMLIERNVQIGDIMEVDDKVGRVTRIGVRTSTIKSRDGINLIIPNSKFINDTVINWSAESHATRFRVKVGVAYGTDERLVRDVLLKTVNDNTDVMRDQEAFAPMVRLVDFGDSSLDFELLFWTHNIFPVENLKSDIRFAILEGFRNNDISIPFPQRDLHIISDHTKKVERD